MQKLSICTKLNYRFSDETDCLFQLELAQLDGQTLESGTISFPKGLTLFPLAGDGGVGSRFWLKCTGDFHLQYDAEVTITRVEPDIGTLSILPPSELAAETVRYLMPSRYCEVGEFQKFVFDQFGDCDGGEKVMAMHDWIAAKLDYIPGSSDVETSAADSFVKRSGVCRDYAHLMIAFARAAAIPARMASVYAPRVDPPDFHALAQLFLADENGVGQWRFVDPTGMADAGEIGLIGVGRDAADISFMTSYGPAELIEQSITVERID